MLEKRKSKRFELKLPFQLLREGVEPVQVEGRTHNLSSGGVLFSSPAQLVVGEPIEYVITLPAKKGEGSVRLRCMGKVVRTHPHIPGEESRHHAVAATLERYEFLRS
jgi:hypothetical protein